MSYCDSRVGLFASILGDTVTLGWAYRLVLSLGKWNLMDSWALFSRLRVQPSEPTIKTKCNTMVRVGRMAYCLNVNDKLVVPSNEQ
jgi:hypothetical protein